jgi:hypothetical protein
MAAFEDLLRELQSVIKDAHKEGSFEKAMEISAKLQAFAGAQAQTAYIVNISDQRFHVPRSYYNIWVEPCGENERYHCTEITSVIDSMDMGLGIEGYSINTATGKRQGKLRTVPVPFSAEQIADDVARQVNGNISEDAFVGVFVSLTEVPTKKALEDAEKRFRKYQQAAVHRANMMWAMKPDHRMIPDFARRAVKALGMTGVPWYEPVGEDWMDCPACQSKIRPGLARCPQPGCGAILDVAKCIEFGIPVPEHMMPKKKGKPAEAEA